MFYPLLNTGFNLGVEGAKATAGIATEKTGQVFDSFTSFSRSLSTNMIIGGVFLIAALILGLKLVNTITK